MSLPETLDWCEEHEMPRCRHAAWVGEHCVGQHPLDGPDVGTCRMVELRVAGRDDLLIRRAADGSWPDWVLDGLGWELDDSHDLSAVMDGVWRERPRAAAEGGET